MANLYNCTIENFIEKQVVEHQTVQTMNVEQQTLKRPDPQVLQSLDGSIPTNYYDFIAVRGLERRKAFVVDLRKAIAEECSKQKNLYKTKGKVLRTVFEPLVLNDKIKRLPQSMEFQALLASAIPGGMSDTSYLDFKRKMEKEHRILQNQSANTKRKGHFGKYS